MYGLCEPFENFGTMDIPALPVPGKVAGLAFSLHCQEAERCKTAQVWVCDVYQPHEKIQEKIRESFAQNKQADYNRLTFILHWLVLHWLRQLQCNMKLKFTGSFVFSGLSGPKSSETNMITYALVLEDSPVTLWGLSSGERISRQLQAIGGVEFITGENNLPSSGRVVLLNGHFLFEIRTIAGLMQRQNTVLVHPGERRPAAVIVDSDCVAACKDYLIGRAATPPDQLACIVPEDLAAFDQALLSAKTPLLEPVREDKKQEMESLLYGNAYKGITDLVTKFLWPRPARKLVQLAANLGVTPNAVTSIGLVLVIAACYLFLHGHYLAGLAAGWIMTLLDTVDGKLARVTVQSSKFGHLFDHVIDLIHPPFWYIFWGMSLSGFQSVAGLDQVDMYWMIVIGYVAGRLVEGLFPLLGNCNVFTWRPFDAYFRLVTARRNPCLIILTLSVVIGRPDWGFIAVTLWTVLSTLVLFVRLLQGFFSRLSQGPLDSWLNAESVAEGPNARAFRLFGSTRGAYAGQ